MTLHYLTISAAVLLLLYHQLTTWLPLYPWNDTTKYTRKEIFLETGSNGLLMGLGALCLIAGDKGFLFYYPLFYYPFLLTGDFFNGGCLSFRRNLQNHRSTLNTRTVLQTPPNSSPGKKGKECRMPIISCCI